MNSRWPPALVCEKHDLTVGLTAYHLTRGFDNSVSFWKWFYPDLENMGGKKGWHRVPQLQCAYCDNVLSIRFYP